VKNIDYTESLGYAIMFYRMVSLKALWMEHTTFLLILMSLSFLRYNIHAPLLRRVFYFVVAFLALLEIR